MNYLNLLQFELQCAELLLILNNKGTERYPKGAVVGGEAVGGQFMPGDKSNYSIKDAEKALENFGKDRLKAIKLGKIKSIFCTDYTL